MIKYIQSFVALEVPARQVLPTLLRVEVLQQPQLVLRIIDHPTVFRLSLIKRPKDTTFGMIVDLSHSNLFPLTKHAHLFVREAPCMEHMVAAQEANYWHNFEAEQDTVLAHPALLLRHVALIFVLESRHVETLPAECAHIFKRHYEIVLEDPVGAYR